MLDIKLPNPEFNKFKEWAEETIQSHYVTLPIGNEKADINGKIYIVRGQQVMLDFELAEVYEYTTASFNRQVKNNIEKFDDDFRFQLTKEELQILRSKNFTSSWGGIRKLPYAFTEQGILYVSGWI